MRPRKVVVLLAREEGSLSLTRFVLDNCGYRVLAALTVDEALAHLLRGGVDAVVTEKHCNATVDALKAAAGEAKVIALGMDRRPVDSHVDYTVADDAARHLNLRTTLRVALVRKRGPKFSGFPVTTVAAKPERRVVA